MQGQIEAGSGVRFKSGRTIRLSQALKLPMAAALALIIAACGDSATAPNTANAPVAQSPDGTSGNGTTPTPPSNNQAGNPIAGSLFWVDPASSAKKQADAWRSTRPADAAQMDKIAAHSQALWFGEWSGDIYAAVNRAVTTITGAGALPVLVAYDIPLRDCGGLS